MPVELLHRLSELGIRTRPNGDRLILNAPSGVLTEKLRDEISAHKAEILAFLRGTETLGGNYGYMAPRTEIEQRLVAIWEEVLELNRVGVEDDFFELGGDWLEAEQMITHIESSLGIRLPLATLLQKATIARLASILERPPNKFGAEVIPIRAQGSKVPIFFLPSIFGEIWDGHKLAANLDPDIPAFGLQPDFSQNRAADFESEVRRYVDALLEFRQKGPYCLAGYSHGGTLAYEMACQLDALGHSVKLLAMIDAGIRLPIQSVSGWMRWTGGFLRNLPLWLHDDILNTPVNATLTRIRSKLKDLSVRFRGTNRRNADGSDRGKLPDIYYHKALSSHALEQVEFAIDALQRYRRKSYAGRVTLIRARACRLFGSFESDLGWSRFARGGVDVLKVAGSHHTLMYGSQLECIGRKLSDALNQKTGGIAPTQNSIEPTPTEGRQSMGDATGSGSENREELEL